MFIKQMDTGKLLQVMDMFTTCIVVMITWVYTYVQIHQIVYISDVQVFLYTNYTSIKMEFKKKK